MVARTLPVGPRTLTSIHLPPNATAAISSATTTWMRTRLAPFMKTPLTEPIASMTVQVASATHKDSGGTNDVLSQCVVIQPMDSTSASDAAEANDAATSRLRTSTRL